MNESQQPAEAAAFGNVYQAYLVPIGAPVGEDSFSLMDLITTLARGWKIVVVVTLLGAAIGVATALLIRPVYRATAVLAPRSEADTATLGRSLASQLGGLAGIAGSLMPTGSNQAETIATLRSRALTEKFIVEGNLLPVLFPDQWDATRGRWRGGDARVPTKGDGFRVFDRDIRTVDEDRKTGLVTVSIDWTDPVLAARWANELVARTNATMRLRASAEAEVTLRYLQKELDRTNKVELRTSLFQLVEAQQKTLMLANTRPEYALRVIDPAEPPGYRDRIWPKRPLIAVLGVLLGALLGAAIVLARRYVKR